MFAKKLYALFLLIYFFADAAIANQFIKLDHNDKLVTEINNFFIKNHNDQYVFWAPVTDGISGHVFKIQRNAFELSKKYKDTSELFYLTDIKTDELIFFPDENKIININKAENYLNFSYGQNILPSTRLGLFYKIENDSNLGLFFENKFVTADKNLGKIKIEQLIHQYPTLNISSVNLFNHESFEVYANVQHKIKSDDIFGRLHYTLFEFLNDIDFNLGAQNYNKELALETYLSFVKKDIQIKFGFDVKKRYSDKNIFFELKLNNVYSKSDINTNISLSSRNFLWQENVMSLKKFRKDYADVKWRNGMKFD